MTDGQLRQRGNALDVRGAKRRYGAVVALAGIDLGVHAGELLTLLGPSGSGKSTLLKIVAGYEIPDEGVVSIGGGDVTSVPPSRRNIGMVFQNYALFPHMTVAQNIAFPLEMRRQDRSSIVRRVDWALETVGLAGYHARRPVQLSGGQQQRVALARAIVFEPDLLLLDEPFGALDKKLREQMQLEVKALQKRLGLTTLFVTHDQEEALVLSDRIAVMDAGRIEQLGTASEIYRRPANRFVADFIGDSNLLTLQIESVENGIARARAGNGVTLQLPARQSGHGVGAGGTVTAVLRPEQIARVKPGDAHDNRLAGRIVDAIYVGDAIKYRIDVGAGTLLTAKWPADDAHGMLAAGDGVEIGWPTAAVHWVTPA